VTSTTDAATPSTLTCRVRASSSLHRRDRRERLRGTENKKLKTGEIEFPASEVTILSDGRPPFYVNDPDATIDEACRLKSAHLPIRREPMQRLLPGAVVLSIREVTTRRLHRGRDAGPHQGAFRRPDSSSRPPPAGQCLRAAAEPQQLKQLRWSPHDRYFQIARCFRDEDSAATVSRIHPADLE
jgi:aspartyl-tRNA synthetase